MLLYRFLMALLLPVMAAATVLGRWPAGALAERLGLAPMGHGPAMWVHGASLGELTSARAVIAALAADGPVLVTTNTATGRALVAGWGLTGVTVALAPFDAAGAAARVIARWRIAALVVIENEFWPARVAACARARVPVIVLGARMSQRSARRWRWAGAMMARMLAVVAYLSAQDAASEARLVALGLPADRVGPRVNLKAGVIPHVAVPGPVPRARCVLAASTHEGEEGLILDAFMAAREAGVFDLLILAPRHPARGGDVARLISARGLAFGMRSKGDGLSSGVAVYLADTVGEMDLWYGMAGVTVIGGSFAPKGGHTPFEPAAHGSAMLHGPSVHNFSESYAALAQVGGVLAVADGTALAAALCAMTPAQQDVLAAAATGELSDEVDVAGLLEAIRKHRVARRE